MDLSYGPEYEAFRGEVRAFLAEHWPDDDHAAFRARAIEAGHLARSIPKRYGGSEQEPDVLKAEIIREEFRAVRAPGDPVGIGPSMLVPTLLEKGEEWQKERWVGATMRGEVIWCQGYSEPGSGSDLASLQTRAELVDDHWVITGQKIWTSGADRADFMFCLCRTEPEAQKHAGISYLLIAMDQPGIEVSPLRQMTGGSTFNQVFLNDVRTPADWIVGKRGEGWLVSRTTLKHERNMIGGADQICALFDGVVRIARELGRADDPAVRQRLALLEGYVRSHQYSSYFQLSRAAHGQAAGIVQMMNKLNGTNINQEISKLALDLLGAEGLLEPVERTAMREAPGRRRGWIHQYMASLGGSIAGGTANIQRNIIAERGLGLPRDYYASRRP